MDGSCSGDHQPAFWAGLHWAEPSSKGITTRPLEKRATAPGDMLRVWTVAGLSIVVAALWPALASVLKGAGPDDEPRLLPIVAQGNWKESDLRLSDWEPHYSGARTTLDQTFDGRLGSVGVIATTGDRSRDGSSSTRRIRSSPAGQRWVQPHRAWAGSTGMDDRSKCLRRNSPMAPKIERYLVDQWTDRQQLRRRVLDRLRQSDGSAGRCGADVAVRHRAADRSDAVLRTSPPNVPAISRARAGRASDQ
jgi:hypothetical protein